MRAKLRCVGVVARVAGELGFRDVQHRLCSTGKLLGEQSSAPHAVSAGRQQALPGAHGDGSCSTTSEASRLRRLHGCACHGCLTVRLLARPLLRSAATSLCVRPIPRRAPPPGRPPTVHRGPHRPSAVNAAAVLALGTFAFAQAGMGADVGTHLLSWCVMSSVVQNTP